MNSTASGECNSFAPRRSRPKSEPHGGSEILGCTSPHSLRHFSRTPHAILEPRSLVSLQQVPDSSFPKECDLGGLVSSDCACPRSSSSNYLAVATGDRNRSMSSCSWHASIDRSSARQCLLAIFQQFSQFRFLFGCHHAFLLFWLLVLVLTKPFILGFLDCHDQVLCLQAPQSDSRVNTDAN